MALSSRHELPTVDDWEDVPAFANEDEEDAFWATHGLGGAALESLGTLHDDALPPPRPRRRRVVTAVSDFVRDVPFQPCVRRRTADSQSAISPRALLRAS